MLEHRGRDTVLVLLATVLAMATIYGLWLYNQVLSTNTPPSQGGFWQALRVDLAKKENALHGTTSGKRVP